MTTRMIVAALLLAAAPLFAAPAQAQSADTICPRATPKVEALNEAAKGGDAAKVAAAARGVADAYLICFNDAKVNTYIEPTANYDETRLAQYLVVVGRAYAAEGKSAEAAQAFKEAMRYADEVVEWTPASQTVHQSAGLSGNSSARNADRRPSKYRETALDVRAAAKDALAKLSASASPSPAAAPSPKP